MECLVFHMTLYVIVGKGVGLLVIYLAMYKSAINIGL